MKILEMIQNHGIENLNNASDAKDYTLLQLATMMRSYGYSVLETCRVIKRIDHVKNEMMLLQLKRFVESIQVDKFIDVMANIQQLKARQKDVKYQLREINKQLREINKQLDAAKLAAIKEATSLKEVRAILR